MWRYHVQEFYWQEYVGLHTVIGLKDVIKSILCQYWQCTMCAGAVSYPLIIQYSSILFCFLPRYQRSLLACIGVWYVIKRSENILQILISFIRLLLILLPVLYEYKYYYDYLWYTFLCDRLSYKMYQIMQREDGY